MLAFMRRGVITVTFYIHSDITKLFMYLDMFNCEPLKTDIDEKLRVKYQSH